MNCCLKCTIHVYTSDSCVHIEIIQVVRGTSTVNLSNDGNDFFHVRYNDWRHKEIMWPLPVASFSILWIFWTFGGRCSPSVWWSELESSVGISLVSKKNWRQTSLRLWNLWVVLCTSLPLLRRYWADLQWWNQFDGFFTLKWIDLFHFFFAS